MSVKDLHNNQFGVVAVKTTTVTTDTTTAATNNVDTQGFEATEFYMIMGAITDGDYALVLTESDTSGSGYTAVADADLLGTEPAFTTNTDDDRIGRVGYIGSKRYLRATVVSTNTATNGGTFTVMAVQGKPNLGATSANAG